MNARGLRTVLVATVCCGLSAAAQSVSAFSGHVSDNAQRPVANLQVRLRPPQNSSVAAQIGVTDSGGNFAFPRVQPSTYLLEVSQGPYLLYRTVVKVPQAPVNIVVQRK